MPEKAITPHGPKKGSGKDLRVLHCLRAPVGGLFRHVCDLARAQSDAGYDVGIVCSDAPNDASTLEKLSLLGTFCSLGVERISLGRWPGVSDMHALRACSRLVSELQPDIVHGHGAKGGVLARLVRSQHPISRFYTPHGGSVHFSPTSLAGVVFGAAERLMMKRTDGFIFESSFARNVFTQRFGTLLSNASVVHNGLALEEFEDVSLVPAAADFVFLGELRLLKGIFTLIDAVALLGEKAQVSLAFVGDGPDRAALVEKIAEKNLTSQVRLLGAMPAREAFARGRIVVMPSHHDSFPYVALEAAAAGRPLVATRTGGIPEIFGPFAGALVTPGDAKALAAAMDAKVNNPSKALDATADLRARVRSHFSIEEMAKGVASVYQLATSKMEEQDVIATPAVGIRVKMDVAE